MQVRPGDQVVLRAWSWDVEPLKRNATVTYLDALEKGKASPTYGVSVFASDELDGSEDLDEVKRALVAVVREVRQFKRAAFTTKRRLEEEGFVMERNGVDYHYDVVLGHNLVDTDVERLKALFDEYWEKV